MILAMTSSLFGQTAEPHLIGLDQWVNLSAPEREKLFRLLSRDVLQRLKHGKDDSLALQAAWKITTNSLHTSRGSKIESMDSHPLAYFLGFVEGREKLELPIWFSKTVLTATETANDLPVVAPRDVVAPKVFMLSKWLRSTKELTVNDDVSLQIATKKFSIDVPSGMIQRSSDGIFGDVDCLTDANLTYVS